MSGSKETGLERLIRQRREEGERPLSNFAINLQRLLGLHRCTQQRAGQLLGVSRTTVANWTSGAKEPNLSSLTKMAEVFEIDPIRFAQLPFVELLEDLLDVPRFLRVEARILDEARVGIEAGRKVVPLKEDSTPSETE